jgi:hypothetical protein
MLWSCQTLSQPSAARKDAVGAPLTFDLDGRCGPLLSIESTCPSVHEIRLAIRWSEATPLIADGPDPTGPVCFRAGLESSLQNISATRRPRPVPRQQRPKVQMNIDVRGKEARFI